MSRHFINDDHRQMTSELDAEMAAMGFVDDGQGNFVPAPGNRAPEPIPQPPVPTPTPTVQMEPRMVTPPSPQPTPQPQNHDWIKREQDAREAQRQLSIERNGMIQERQLLAQERAEATNTLMELRAMREAAATLAIQPQAMAAPALSQEFRDEYPDFANAIDTAFSALQAEVQHLRSDRQKDMDDAAIAQEQDRRRLFMDRVRSVHPDAESIFATPEFAEWKDAQSRTLQLVLEETYNLQLGFQPEDLIDVLNRYKVASRPAFPTREIPRGLQSVDPSNPGLAQGGEPNGQEDFVFSLQEMRDASLIDRWMQHPEHRKNRKTAMDRFDAAWERSVAFHNRNR